MPLRATLWLMLMLMLAGRDATANVMISEIMYNPQGTDRQTSGMAFDKEWVEIFNTGTETVDLGGWTLEDLQDGMASVPIESGVLLYPNESLVLTGDVVTFDANWGPGINRYQVTNFPGFANSPSPVNETVALRDRVGTIRDQVNYDDEGSWPADNGSDGNSIFVSPGSLSASDNDSGNSWLPAMAGVYGARFVNAGGLGENHGSPGFVATQPQTEFVPSPDTAWSAVVFPDTQNYAKSSVNKFILGEMTNWVAEQRDVWNVQVALHEGDIVNNNNTNAPSSGDQVSTQQWQIVREAFVTLDGVVPYVLATGNHDHGTTNAQTRDTRLNDYFHVADNPLNDPQQGGILRGTMEPDRLENAYYEFTAPDGRQMLIFSLEWGPRQQAVDWAQQIAAQAEYQQHTSVLLTHAYMFHDETRYDWSRNLDADPDNNQSGNPHSYPTGSDTHDGEELWNELVRNHANFELAFSGHVGGDGLGYLASTADGDNLVHQMLFNSQFESNGGNGWLRILEFLEDGRTVRVRTFSPHFGLERMDQANRFELEISPLFNPCDFDQDRDCDVADLNLMLATGDLLRGVDVVVGVNELFDLTGDDRIDQADLDQWLTTAAASNGFDTAYKRGDGNLNGSVDVSDFNLWNVGKFTTLGTWNGGDFNGDGLTDVSDFNLWNISKFTASDAVNSVPEPASWLLLGGSMLTIFTARRRVSPCRRDPFSPVQDCGSIFCR